MLDPSRIIPAVGRKSQHITLFSDHFSADTAMAVFNCCAAFFLKKKPTNKPTPELVDKEAGLKPEAFLITSAPSHAKQQQEQAASWSGQRGGSGPVAWSLCRGGGLQGLAFVPTQLESSGQQLLPLESSGRGLCQPGEEGEVAIQGGFLV